MKMKNFSFVTKVKNILMNDHVKKIIVTFFIIIIPSSILYHINGY